MKLTSRGRAVVIVAVVLVLILLAVLIWRLGPGRAVSEQQIAVAQVYQQTEQLRDDDLLDELPQQQRDELREELDAQLEALGRPSERVLQAAQDKGMPVGVSQEDYVPGLPGAFLADARMIVHGPSIDPEQQVVLSSIAAHRAATALELGADAQKVGRAVPELTGEDALPAVQEGQEAPAAMGGSAHPELALARQLGQARLAAQTWSHLPSQQAPSSSAWAEALLPLQDSDWMTSLEQRHPSVIDGSPGMPEGFREDPEAARDRLTDQLQDTALAQIAAAADPEAQDLDSVTPDPGTAVLMSLAIARAQDEQPVGALPGLED